MSIWLDKGRKLSTGAYDPAWVLGPISSTKHEFHPVEQVLNPIRKQLVTPKTPMSLFHQRAGCYGSSQGPQLNKPADVVSPPAAYVVPADTVCWGGSTQDTSSLT